MIKKNTVWNCILAGILSCASAEEKPATSLAGKAPAQSPEAAIQFKKPSWLPELSLVIKESYDDNVYAAGADRSFFPSPLPALPGGSAMALKGHSSWVTTVSPKIAVDLVPLLGSQKTVQAMALGYTPDFSIYHGASTESYDAHRFTTAIKVKTGDFSGSVENGFRS